MLDHLYKTEIERTVLSTFIMDNEEFFNSEHTQDLFTENNIHIYNSIKNLIISGVSADISTLSEDLKGVVSVSQIIDVVDSPVSATNINYYLQVLSEAEMRRKIHYAYTKGCELVLSGSDPLKIHSDVNSKISNIEITKTIESYDLSHATLSEIEDEVRNGKEIGIKTGILGIDNATNGFYPTEFIIIAGRPGSGKTSLLLNMVRNFGFFYEPGIIFSLEMSNKQLMRRMYCDVGSINGAFLFQNKLKENSSSVWKSLKTAAEKVSDMPIIFDDQATITIDTIYSRAKKAKLTKNISWIAIDHLGLIKGWNEAGQEPKAEITRACKAMAKDLDCSVIVLSQMNREIEKGKKRAPVMSDLRDAGSIEQDADIVIFPTVPNKNPKGTNGDEYDDAEIFIAKTRRGWVCKLDNVKWQGHYFRYSNKEKF